MTTQPKYEDLVLKVAEMERRETALRESLTDKREEYNKLCDRYDALQQLLTVEEQRAGELEGLLRDASAWIKSNSFHGTDAIELWERIDAALKPAAEGEGS